MMCHPKTGDLLLSRGRRVLSGLCLRRGMCSGRDVLHLHGRVPSRGSRRLFTGAPGAAPARKIPGQPGAEALNTAHFAYTEQHPGTNGVGLKKLARSPEQESYSRTEDVMAQELTSPFVRTGGSPASGTSTRVLPSRFREPMAGTESAALAPEIADGALSRRNKQCFTPRFRRTLRKNATGGQISTGTSLRIAKREVPRTSVIVLVTPSGNVTVRAN